MIRLGISIGSRGSADDPREGARSVVAQAQAANQAGLDLVCLGDHHSTAPAYYVQNVPMLGRVLAEWDSRPAGCLFLLPLWHPVLMAEQVGTLATIAEGPFVVQVGGGGGAAQFGGMGVPLARRGVLLEEGIQLVQRLLAGERVDIEPYGVEGAQVCPIPPEPVEWWIGGGVAVSIDRAARLGDAWYANATVTLETAKALLPLYLDACSRHDRKPRRIALRKDVYLDESRAAAERVGDELMAHGYRGFVREAVAYGDPESVAEQLAPFGELGFTDLVIRVMSVPTEAAVRTVQLAGEVRRLLQGI